MQEDLRAVLLAAPSVAALTDTVQWGERGQGTALPAAVLTTISEVRSYAQDGDNNLQQTRVQIDCYGATYASARGLARAITTALTAFRGPVGTTDFRGIFKDGDRDFREGSTQGVDAYFRATLDFLVHYKEQ